MFHDNFGQFIIEDSWIFSLNLFQKNLKYFPKFSQKLPTGFFNFFKIRRHYFLKVTLKNYPFSFLKIYRNF